MVQDLYNKVTDSGRLYWMYEGNEDNYKVEEASESSKMKLVGNNLKLSRINEVNCYSDSNKIPSTLTYEDMDMYKSKHPVTVSSVCQFNKDENWNSDEIGFSKEYIEEVYQDLFGKNAKLNIDIVIPMDLYNGEVYKYVKYMKQTGGTGCGSTSGEIIKAVTDNKTLKIYEKLTVEKCNDKTGAIDKSLEENKNIIYTFELENDGMYKFVSRLREK